MEYTIIKVTCTTTGMSYITHQKYPGFLGSGTKIKKAIEEHGKENFTVEVLEENIYDIDEANAAIGKYIKQYQSWWPTGYNSRQIGLIPQMSPLTRAKISKANKGRRSPRKGAVVSLETRIKQSLAKQGKKLKRKPVEFIDNQTGNVLVFDGVQAAADYFKVTQGYISHCKRDKTRMIQGRFTAHP